MIKKETKYLLIITIIGCAFRLYSLRNDFFIGNDAFIHASVIRQGLATGNLDTYGLGFNNPVILEPLGFYYVTLIPSLFVGLDVAFLLMPLVSGIACIVISYYLFKELFNKRVGLLTALILSMCIAHIYRTSPNTYRGDGFFLTIFIAILYFFIKSINGTKRESFITGFLLAVSATVWNGYPIGVLVIISGLIIDSTIKFINNKFSKSDLIKTFTLLCSYYFIEYLFILSGVVKILFFTRNTAFHMLITFSPLIVGVIYLFTKKVRKNYIFTVMVIAGAIILALNFNTISSMISEGLFENSVFFDVGVTELLPPTYDLLFNFFSITLYSAFIGLIILFLIINKHRKIKHFFYLIWVSISLWLMLSYSRYSFIASITIASLTALIINKLYLIFSKNNKLVTIAVITFLTIYSINSISKLNILEPRMNDEWLKAFNYMNENLTKGVVLSWWDYGSWIQYYTGFITMTDSVSGQDTGRIKNFAEFLLTNKTMETISFDYLMISSNEIEHIGLMKGLTGIEQFNVYRLVNGELKINSEGVIYRDVIGRELKPTRTYIVNGSKVQMFNSTLNETRGCLIINNDYLFLDDYACSSNYFKLMYGEGLKSYELLYKNNQVVLFEVVV